MSPQDQVLSAPVVIIRCSPISRAILLIVLLLHISGFISLVEAAESPLPTAEILFSKLDSLYRRLRSVRVVAADRNETFNPPKSFPHLIIRWHDLYFDDDNLQVRTDWQYDDKEDWWRPKQTSSTPLSADDLGSFDGITCCYRPHGEYSYTEIIKPSKEKKLPYPISYAAYSVPRALNSFYFPFLSVGRAWNSSDSPTLANSLLLDRLHEIDYQRWDVVGRDSIDGKDAIKVTVSLSLESAKFTLEKHSGTLECWDVLRVWFSDDQHNFPIRIETDRRFIYNGAEIRIEYPGDGRPGPVLIAGDYINYGGDLWYPASGKQINYTLEQSDINNGPTLDDLVSDGLQQGFWTNAANFAPTTTRTWKVTTIEDLASGTNLWVEPPLDALFYNVNLDIRRIVGKSEEESNKILGIEIPVRNELHVNKSNKWLFLLCNAIIAVIVTVWFAVKGLRKAR